MNRVSRDDLEELVARLNTVSERRDLALAGAYDGWRVEDEFNEDALGTGFVKPKALAQRIECVTRFLYNKRRYNERIKR